MTTYLMAKISKTYLGGYDYHLPQDQIAQFAFHPRDHCKLLVLKGEKIDHQKFYDIIDYLDKDDVLVLNETKVSRTKLIGKKATGTPVEIMLLKPVGPLIYQCNIKGKRLQVGNLLLFAHNTGKIIARQDSIFTIQFQEDLYLPDVSIPTPPYIKRKIQEEDYQTVFARKEGSLAAPTAGLHFTPDLLKKIQKKGIIIAHIILHISTETFLPVRDINTHRTGREYFEIDAENAVKINDGIDSRKIIAVGTTVVKCLESCQRDKAGKIISQQGYSQIFITSGYQFKTPIKAMITNFHLPKSSLLLLTCAYGGRERIMAAYQEAIAKKYRFYSLGDAMLVVKENKK